MDDNQIDTDLDKKDLREKIQAQVVEIISRGLEEGSINEDRARAIAQLIIESLPEGLSEQQLIEVIPKLDNEFRELSEVVLPIVIEYETKLKSAASRKVIDLANVKKFSEATALARRAIEESKKLGQ